MNSFRQDLSLALRMLFKRPAAAAVALLTLTITIGANTAAFTLISGILLQPLHYPRSRELVRVAGLPKSSGGLAQNLSLLDFRDFERTNRTFRSLGAFSAGIGSVTVTGFGEAERVRSAVVSGNFFPTLAAKAGRLLQPQDDEQALNVAVISHELWESHYGANRSVVGGSVSIGSVSFTIVGVLPARFRYPQPELQGDPQIYLPAGPDSAAPSRSSRNFRAIARLAPGMTLEQGKADLASLARELEQRYPADNLHAGVTVQPLIETIVGDSRRVLWFLFAGTACVLLIGCANLASLMLARGLGRTKEIAIRAALGATRRRLVRQLLTESLMLSLLGGLGAVVFAEWVLKAALYFGRQVLPRAGDVQIDWEVLLFSLLLSAASSLFFGTLPAWRLSKIGLEQNLRQGGRTGDLAASGASAGLVFAEVAVCMTLVCMAALLVKSFWKLSHVDMGFHAEEIISADISLPVSRYPQSRRVEFYEDLYRRLGGLSMVRGVAAINIVPLSGNHSCDAIQVDDRTAPAGGAPCAETRSISNAYFDVMGVPVLRGRAFSNRDDANGQKVIMVNQAMADWLWPGQNPLGRTITLISLGSSERPRLVVGVVGNTAHASVGEAPVPQYFIPQRQPPGYPAMTLVVRVDRQEGVIPAMRSMLSQMDPTIPLYRARALADLRDASVAAPRFRTVTFGAFGVIALVLAMGGVYGVLSCTVNERMRELGLRMCLGASKTDIARLLLRQSMWPIASGMAIGGFGALVAKAWIASLLYGGVSLDPWILGVVCAAVGMAALAAMSGPLRRAVSRDPGRVLRES